MTGVRVCLKELYGTKYDPLSISYTVLSGRDKKCLFFYFIYLFCITGIGQKHRDQYVETLQNLQQIPDTNYKEKRNYTALHYTSRIS